MGKFRWLYAALVALAITPVALAAQQPAVVTGRVTNESGNPVANASVFIQSINVGSTTRADGTYTLTVPASRIVAGRPLEISALGPSYKRQNATVNLVAGQTTTQNFALGLDVLELEGIVATGQGTVTTRERLTTAVSTVKSEEITRSNETNIVAALAGKAPNVQVTSSAGDPGAGAYIQIRGAASITGGTQPLFVVDGTPIDNTTFRVEGSTAGTVATNRAADVNPADIERVEILKGAAATAIYGSRGANGVVLITTKSGKAGSTRASFSSSVSFDNVNETVPLQTRWGQGLFTASPTSALSWGPLLGADVPIFDHATEVYQTGNKFENNLTLSGGSEKTTYYLSLGRLDHQGVIVGPQGYDRTTVRLKGSHFFNEDIKVSGNVAYTNSDGSFVQQGSNISGIQLGALRTPPNFNNRPYIDPATGLHRSYRCNPEAEIARGRPSCVGGTSFFSITGRRGYDNPFWVAYELPNTSTVGRTNGNVTLDYTPLSWLAVTYQIGADYWADERLSLFPKSTSDQPAGRLIRADAVNQIVDSNLLLTATGRIGQNIDGSITLGQNLNQQVLRINQVNGTTLFQGTGQTDFAVTTVGDEYAERVRTDGYFLTGEATFWDQFTLNATARVDGSSTFGRGVDAANSTGEGDEAGQGDTQTQGRGFFGEGRFFYPGIGASWVFTRQGMFDGVPGVDFGKLRASFGVSGREPPAFSNVSVFSTGYFGDGWLNTGLYSTYFGNEGARSAGTLGNPNIAPERKAEIEAGLDLAFLDQRVSLGVTYYNSETTDAILALSVPTSSGYGAQFQNAASFENQGWEVTLGVDPVRTENFNWNINAQWATNNSCVTALPGSQSFGLNGFTGSTVSVVAPELNERGDIVQCYPFGVFFGDDFVRFGRGIEVDGVNIDTRMAEFGARPGDIYVAADGYPIYDDVYRVGGDPNPDWTGSVRSTFTFFNNLTLSGLVDIKKGGQMWNGTKGALYYFGTHADTDPFHGDGQRITYAEYVQRRGQNDRVAGPGVNQEADFDAFWFLSNIGSGFTGPFTQFIEDAGFVKLRDITLSYSFINNRWLTRAGFTSLDLALSGRNLRTWTDYTGIDPESNLTGQSIGRGLDYFNNPQTRSWVISVNLNR